MTETCPLRVPSILFFQVNQNLTTICLLIFVFSPILTYFYQLGTQNCFVLMFITISCSQQVKTGMNGLKHRNQDKACIHLAVHQLLRYFRFFEKVVLSKIRVNQVSEYNKNVMRVSKGISIP